MRRSAAIVVRLAAAALALLLIEVLCVAPYRANLALRDVMRRSATAQTSDPQTAAVLARRNIEDLDNAAAARRLDPAWYMLYAANSLILDHSAAAMTAYDGALRVDQRPELYLNRGMLLFHLGRVDDAVPDLAKAVRFNRDNLAPLRGDVRARVAAAAGVEP